MPCRWRWQCPRTPGGGSQGKTQLTQTPFLNPDPFQHWQGIENVAKVKINGESCMDLLDNGMQVNTIMPNYVKNHSLDMGLITDLIGTRVTCVDLGNAYTSPLGYVIVWVQVDKVQGYDEDQRALVVPDVLKFSKIDPCYFGNPHYKLYCKCYERERNRCIGNTLGKCKGGASIVIMQSSSHSGGWWNHGKGQSIWVQQGGGHEKYRDYRCFFFTSYTCYTLHRGMY